MLELDYLREITSFSNPCEGGHASHQSYELYGIDTLATKDVPFHIFNWRIYRDTVGYCPGDDVVSQTIENEHYWERHITHVAQQILSQNNRNNELIIDVGAQIGWYSRLALEFGWDTVAIESNAACLQLAEMNCRSIAKRSELEFDLYQLWVASNISSVPVPLPIKLLKSDIEGNDFWTYRLFQESFKQQTIEYAIFEISPIFNETYPALLEELFNCGYTCYRIDARYNHDEWKLENYKEKLCVETQVDVLFQRNDGKKRLL